MWTAYLACFLCRRSRLHTWLVQDVALAEDMVGVGCWRVLTGETEALSQLSVFVPGFQVNKQLIAKWVRLEMRALPWPHANTSPPVPHHCLWCSALTMNPCSVVTFSSQTLVDQCFHFPETDRSQRWPVLHYIPQMRRCSFDPKSPRPNFSKTKCNMICLMIKTSLAYVIYIIVFLYIYICIYIQTNILEQFASLN